MVPTFFFSLNSSGSPLIRFNIKDLIYLSQIIHRDLAARNVFVGAGETCKVTDFGMARDVLDDNIYQMRSKVLNYFEPKVGVEIS